MSLGGNLGSNLDDMMDNMGSGMGDIMDAFSNMGSGSGLDFDFGSMENMTEMGLMENMLDHMMNMTDGGGDMADMIDVIDMISDEWEDLAMGMKDKIHEMMGRIRCDDLKMMDHGLEMMGDKFLMNLNLTHMKDDMCLDLIRNVSDYMSDNQSKAIIEAAKEAFGDVMTWDKADILKLGRATKALSYQDYMDMTPDRDILEMIGKFDDLSEDQTYGLYRMSVSIFGDEMFNDMNGMDLAIMGQAICGAPVEKFRNLTTMNFRAMQENLGELYTCGDAKLEAMAEKAKETFGDVSTWDDMTMEKMGVIIGGLEYDEIRNLTGDQLMRLKDEAIPHLPAKAFRAFSMDQLEKLPYGSLDEIPEDRMGSMDPSKKSYLRELMMGLINRGSGGGSGSGSGSGGMMPGPEMPGPEMGSGTGGFNPDFDPRDPLASKDSILSGDISKDQIMEMDMQDFRDFDMSELESIAGAFTDEMLGEVCAMMMEGGDAGMLKSLSDGGVDCLNHLDAADQDISAGAAKELLDQKMAAAPPADWTDSDWGTVFDSMGDAVDPATIKEMDSGVMRTMIEGGSFSAHSMTRPDQKRAMADEITEAFGAADSWTSADLASLADGDYLGQLVDASDLRKMDPTDIAASLESFADVVFDDPSKQKAVGKLVKEGLGGRDAANSWSADQIKGAAQYIMEDIGVLNQLSLTDLRGSLSNFSSFVTEKKDALAFGKRMKEMTDFQDPTALDDSKIGEIAAFLPAMGKSYMRDLPSAALVSNLASLGAADFTPGDAKEMVDKLAENLDFSSIDTDTMFEMGNLIAGFAKDQLEQVPAATMDNATFLANMADLDMSPAKARAIMSKLKSNNGGSGLGSNAKVLGKMIKQVGLSELEGTSITDFGLDCSNTDTLSLEPDAAQSKVLVKKLKEMYGEMASTNTNYTSSCFTRWGKIAAQGMAKEDIQNLRTDDELKGIAEKMADNEDEMDEAQGKAMSDKIKSAMLATDNDFKQMTEATIEQCGKFFKFFDDADLDKFNDTMKPTIARKIGEASMDKVSKDEMIRLKKWAMKHILRSDTNVVTDRSGAAELDDNDIRDMGNLRCGLELADMAKLSQDAIENNAFEMSKKCGFDTDTGKALLDKAEEKVSNLLSTSDTVVMVAALLPHADSTQLGKISTAVWEESFSDIGDAIKERTTALEKRDVSFSSERDTTQRDAEKANKQTFFSDGLAAYAASTSSKRRKRSTSYTCSDISLLGDLTILTTTDIAGITTTEFEDCAETLGAESAWDSDQLTSLSDKAVETWGSVSGWTSTNVQSAGAIVAGLTAAEIQTLPIDADAMSAIGAYDIFTSDQLAKGYLAYVSTTGTAAASFSSDDLISLGAFVCGATETNIGDFPTASYYDAASTVGDQTMCDSGQLQALADLAKDSSVFGASSSWDSSTITTVGSVVGGLSTSEISALTETQISSISTSDLALIPAAKFAGFSATQVGYFTFSQASAVTSDQEAALSADAQSALNTILGTTDDTDSGAGYAPYSVLLLTVAAFINKL